MEITNSIEKKIFSVSEISRIIKGTLEEVFPALWVQGEVSNCTHHTSGHVYFSLKDDEATLRCVLFRGRTVSVHFKIEDGLQIMVRGNISSYIKRGEYQLIAEIVEPAGKGALQLAFEQLKEKLEKEGFFKEERKKPIPLLPQKIGIVTSPTGAAIHDILTVINRRYANVHILIYPVRVQGEGAAEEIAAGIAYFNGHHPDTDVLLVGRGGGSLEDLWAFNEEITVRAIFNSTIPVISCVGHEVDFTISDFVADLRAPTPSVAAELVVKNKEELRNSLLQLSNRMIRYLKYFIISYEEKLAALIKSRALKNPIETLNERIQIIDDMKLQLTQSIAHILEESQAACTHLFEKLTILSPLACLARGYSITWKLPEKNIIRTSRDLNNDDTLHLKFHHGEATFTIKNLKKSNAT